jgi:LCP family protein required for cell wall assembly
MLDFTRNNANRPRRRVNSIDGFSAAPRSARAARPRVDNFRARGTVGDFKQSTGFYNTQKPQMFQDLKTHQTPQGGLRQNRHHRAAMDSSVTELAVKQQVELGAVDQKHAKKRRKLFRFSKRKFFLRSFSLLLLIALLGGGYIGVKAWIVNKNIFAGGGSALALNKDIDPSKLTGEGDGRINILLLGKGGEDHPGGELTDTIMIASIDPIGKEAALLSIPRDMWVKVDGSGSMKINSVYNTYHQEALSEGKKGDVAISAGVTGLENTIESYMGIQIHYYVSVDFAAYKEMVDTVGGLDITLDNAIYDPNFDWEYGKNALKLPAGPVHLTGTTALLLGRSRGAAGGYGVGSDFDRNENQRKMMIALKQKILSAGIYGNPAKINELLNTFSDNVRTNFNGAGDLLRLYNIFKDIPDSSIKSLSFVDEPNVLITTSNIAGQSVVVPSAGTSDYSKIKAFVRSSLVDGFIKSEVATVSLYNGTTTSGLATKRAEELKSYGYNVVTVESAPSTNYTTTTLIDNTKGVKKYTKRYLEQRFGVTATTELPSELSTNTSDFVIILGSNEKISR